MKRIESAARKALALRRDAICALIEKNRDDEANLSQEIDPDWPDRASQQVGVGLLHRLAERERNELGEIDAALERIAKGSYGKCEQCGQAIQPQRLRALAEARRCLSCSQAADEGVRGS